MRTELAVIGGGPAGYTAAIRGAQRALDTVLIEASDIGGTCLNHGCIPSKALLEASETAYSLETASEMGIYVEPYVDFSETVAWKDGVVNQLTEGVENLCRANGIELLEGTARFEDQRTLTIDGGSDRTVRFDQAVIATGSRPISVPGFEFSSDRILDAKAALSLDQVPPRLLVVGAGYIGMELSTVFARLGSDVTVVEQLEEPLPQYGPALTEPVTEAAAELGIEFKFDQRVTDWTEQGESAVVTAKHDDGTTHEYEADYVLVAVGRRPVTDGLSLESTGVRTAESGAIRTDERGRTDAEGVFAVGDVAGEPMLAHAGIHEGLVAVDTITGEDPETDRPVPTVVFTEPEIATVGQTPAEAEAADLDPIVGRFPFAANGRAMTLRSTEGFVRIVADGDGRVVGGQIVGPDASELIGEIGVAVRTGATLKELATTVHTHPTLSEAIAEAIEHARSEAIHRTNR